MLTRMEDTAPSKPWYYDYEAKVKAVVAAKTSFCHRCIELGLEPQAVLLSYTQQIVASAVHESNWQEGVEVSAGRTRELSDIIFSDFPTPTTPGLDLAKLLKSHRTLVVDAKRKKMSDNEIITLNLSATYKAITLLLSDILARYCAILAKTIEKMVVLFPGDIPPDLKDLIAEEKKAVAKIFSESTLGFPVTHDIKTGAEFFAKSGHFESSSDLDMIEVRHVHFLHRLLFTGVFPVNRCGAFRKSFVNVGRQDLVFPPPSAVPPLMEEFVRSYPLSAAFGNSSDIVMAAAKFSHRFVAIHPYNDGNGRISRALMNLVLCGQHPFVALKATTSKSRRRYYYSLRRADRGDLRPLACLIAISLVGTYEQIMSTLGKSSKS